MAASTMSGDMLIVAMFRSWFKIVTEVSGSEIVVTMPGTSYRIIYTHMGKGQLVANSFSTAKGTSASTIAFPKLPTL